MRLALSNSMMCPFGCSCQTRCWSSMTSWFSARAALNMYGEIVWYTYRSVDHSFSCCNLMTLRTYLRHILSTGQWLGYYMGAASASSFENWVDAYMESGVVGGFLGLGKCEITGWLWSRTLVSLTRISVIQYHRCLCQTRLGRNPARKIQVSSRARMNQLNDFHPFHSSLSFLTMENRSSSLRMVLYILKPIDVYAYTHPD